MGNERMNEGNRFRRKIAAGMLASVLALGMMAAPMPQAYAEDGTVTIAQKDNVGAKYDVYKIFKADVADGSSVVADRMASHVKWADNTTRSAVVAYLLSSNNPAPQGYDAWLIAEGHLTSAQAAATSGANKTAADNIRYNPQNAAEYISKMVDESANDTGANTTPPTKKGGAFASELAQAVVGSLQKTGTATAGQAFTAEEGLYLFVTDASTIGTGETGTAAMWVPIGSATRTITEKTAVGSVDKQIVENSSGEYTHGADAANGETIGYKVTTTMPSNLGAYDKYFWKVVDTHDARLQLTGGNTSSVKVMAGSRDITSMIAGDKGSITYSGNVLTVQINDLLTLANDLNITKDTVVTVTYNTVRKPGSTAGAAGNEVEYTHSGGPVADPDVTEVVKNPPQHHSYKLEVTKVDKATGEALSGAKFTIKAGTGHANAGKYVQADGTLGTNAYEFTTNTAGKIIVEGVDAGPYVMHETAAPNGYEIEDADINLTVTSTINPTTGALTNLAATVTGGEAAADATEVATHVDAVNTSAHSVAMVTSDDKNNIELPITGLGGDTLIYLAAGGVALIAIGTQVVRRRRDNDSNVATAAAGDGPKE